MNIRVVTAAIALATAFEIHAQDALTPAQQDEVRRIFTIEREKLRAEVRAELEAEMVRTPPSAQAGRQSTFRGAGNENAMHALRETASELGEVAAMAPVDRDFQSGDPGVTTDLQLEFDKDKAVAAFAWTRISGPLDTGRDKSKVVSSVTRVRLSAPIDDGENGFASFANLNGLSSGLGLKVSRSWRVTDVGFLNGLWRDDEFRKLCALSGQDPDRECDSEKIFGNSASMEEMQSYIRRRRGVQKQYTLAMNVARSEFDFLTPTLDDDQAVRVGWGMTAGVAFSPASRDRLYSFGFDYLREYKSREVGIYCPLPVAPGPTHCVEGAPGAPGRVTKRLLWGDIRGELAGFAYDLRVTHDFGSSENAVDLPIYLLRNEKGLFSAGIRLGWTETEDFMAGVFISTPLDPL